MNFQEFEKIVKNENSAKKYLLQFCWKNHQRFCPKCRARKLYALRQGRKRCSRCGYTFHDFSQRFVNNGNLTCQQWLRLIKLFELEAPTGRVAEQLNVSYNTAYKSVTTLRMAIMAHSLDARLIFRSIEGLDFGKSGKFHLDMSSKSSTRMPVFGIVERGPHVFVDLIPELDGDSIVHFKMNFHLKTASLGKIIYTDKFKQYAALLTGGSHLSSVYNIRHADKGLCIDSTKGFWSFSKDWFRRLKGISPRNFPLYIKELEFRYNHKNEDIFPILAEFLCAWVPDFEE
ncbi:MAG: transposase [Deltaproteobacteria bacterium]|nr:transposase [Deltaproteobacteria bacterium]